ncbi:MAG: hypothetical protein BWY11_00644 [Firmicutes bacterium ADurb.Bin182]|nr:MAG: hypothetical protein BWY11_00644 [Firmicutes bacterium ADurb.Bin182]
MMRIEDNLNRIFDNIRNAAVSCGRKADEIRLVAVTKFVPEEKIRQALQYGVKDLGENRVQEFTGKYEFFKNYDINIHFIGQLQTNKVKYVIGKVDFIQSLDRLPLAEQINKYAGRLDLAQKVFVEVNIGREPQKAGILPEMLPEFLGRICEMDHIVVKGLMCVPPVADERGAGKYFKQMKLLFDDSRKYFPGIQDLSMGMSNDYTTAILEGATMVRIGTGIFGPRQ